MLGEIRTDPERRRAGQLLVLAFLEDGDRASIAGKLKRIKDVLPEAELSGITDKRVLYHDPDDLVDTYTFLFFSEICAEVCSFPASPGQEERAGFALLAKLNEVSQPRGVLVFGGGQEFSEEDFIFSISGHFPKLPFFGGRAGHVFYGDSDGAMAAFAGKELISDGFVCVLFFGEKLKLRVTYNLGWTPIGRKMTVTKASDFLVDKLDFNSPAEIYARYLGLKPFQVIMENIADFPLMMQRGGLPVCRNPIVIFENGDLMFISPVREGEEYRLSFGNPEEIKKDILKDVSEIREFVPQAIVITNCLTRTRFLGEEEEKKLLNLYYETLPETCIFQGNSELYIMDKAGGELNCSLVSMALREGEPSPEESVLKPWETQVMSDEVPLVNRLITFLDRISGELEDKADEANEASEAKSRFISRISHEIRTPINAILGLDEMLIRESSERQVREYAVDIRNSGRTLLSLINDLLDVSRMESGKLRIMPEEYEVAASLKDLTNMISFRAKEKGLNFEIHVDPDIPRRLYGDETRIRQILLNLLTNGVKYTMQGSVILTLEYEKQGPREIDLLCQVEDTGIGIRSEDLKRIASPYVRFEETVNRNIEGTGLGMSIVTELLGQMGSRLMAASEYGKGSVFSFRLSQKVVDWSPIGDFSNLYREAEEEYRETFHASRARILVVDDMRLNLTVIKGLLKETKVQVDTALSGAQALAMLRKETYDMIFLDQRMPGMDGIETLHRLREMKYQPNAQIPAIMLTANAVSGAREAFLAAGFDAYLSKPVDGKKLEKLVMEYLPPEKVELSGKKQPADREAGQEENGAPREEGLLDVLKRIPDFYPQKGLESCMGDEEIYRTILKEFGDTADALAEQLRQHLREGDLKLYTIRVHALKSSARIIGADGLADRAAELEALGDRKEIETIKLKTPDLLSEYERIGGSIREYLE